MLHLATPWLAKPSQNHGGLIKITLQLLGARKSQKTAHKSKSQRFDDQKLVTWGAQVCPGSPKSSKNAPLEHHFGWQKPSKTIGGVLKITLWLVLHPRWPTRCRRFDLLPTFDAEPAKV